MKRSASKRSRKIEKPTMHKLDKQTETNELNGDPERRSRQTARRKRPGQLLTIGLKIKGRSMKADRRRKEGKPQKIPTK